MILTESRTGGSSCWMKENPRQGSGPTAYDVTMAGGTVREREKQEAQPLVKENKCMAVIGRASKPADCRNTTH